MSQNKTVALHTLGCKLNYSETSAMERMLENNDFSKKNFDEVADVYVINTCSVTDNADKECRQLVRRVQRKSPEATVVITGCYAQLKPEEIAAIPGVDLVLGAEEKFNIAYHLKNFIDGDSSKICSCDIEDVNDFHSSYSLNARTRTFLKVQDGCDYNCSFCTIPMARGKSRSNTIDKVLFEVSQIKNEGVKEIVFTGINLGDFGKNENQEVSPETFYSLLQNIEIFDGVERYRISSIEPNLLTPEIIQLVAGSNKIMPHFHIPLQSGSNKILGLMRRRYRREMYAEKISVIKDQIPHCGIGVDVITGFPGETEDDFQETYQFLSDLDISYLHVFTYSERANTHALKIKPVVPIEIRHQRTKLLRSLSYQKSRDFHQRHSGQSRKVLFEGKNKSSMMDGYTDNYIKIEVPFKEEWSNQIIDWKI